MSILDKELEKRVIAKLDLDNLAEQVAPMIMKKIQEECVDQILDSFYFDPDKINQELEKYLLKKLKSALI